MDITNSVVLVTGANGGMGRAFVADLLKRGAAKIYIAARDTTTLGELLADGDRRLVPLQLDVTRADQVVAAARVATDVTLLVNNAGISTFEGAIAASDMDPARTEMEVNYFGTLAMTRAFAPILAAAGGGTVVNMLSMLSLVSLPRAATYSASKAASLSLTRSIRAELGAQGTQVIGVLAVQTETAMGARMPEPRMTPQELVSDVLDAVQAGTNDEVVAGALSRNVYQSFIDDPKAVQAMMSTRLPQRA
ncbi:MULTISPECIES: SDR family NAD(P)-dependent oxidoreductase [Burkholderia]|uniref:SDR family NAD(P)-dependent oxidoreductase n=1 Tax=Burkholderia TaxID=32008 RepID=UPI00064F47F6|nr:MULTISPECIES: SDR family NAD(P)-dependent oxidoreductase [Burkholderia]KML16339.1 short-chain dehydrogenase [Burkholderia cepacia]KML37138.1 short-chain dehydrogenase [Burkholderia lata]KMN61015.1 short-chain dehydrogenase [Burkholderia sp. LK4]